MRPVLSLPWLLFLLVCLRLPDFFVPYYNIDELTNSLTANIILDGRLAYEDFIGNTYLLTHYFYVAVIWLFGRNDFLPLRLANLVWVVATALAIFAAGREFTQKREGGLWALLCYLFVSVCFYSKDYRAVLSESLSLLPLSLAAFFVFRSLRRDTTWELLAAGFLIGIAGLFKAPAAIMILPLWCTLFFREEGPKLKMFAASGLGLALALFLPLLFAETIHEGVMRMIGRIGRTGRFYIGAYEDLPVLYWGFKYLIRTAGIAVAAPTVWFFAFRTLRREFVLRAGGSFFEKQRLEILFLFFWLLSNWLIVSIGKRVFFHYFVFLIPPLALLAVPYAMEMWDRVKKSTPLLRFLFVFAFVFPPIAWSVEAIYGWSISRPDLSAVIDHVKETTSPTDRIYVWGVAPQIYFFSKRDPATTFFFADTLAGTSPGSPGMEQRKATNNRQRVGETLLKDMAPTPERNREGIPLTGDEALGIFERELFSDEEVLHSIENPFWKIVLGDFTKTPPVLFLDTAPTGIRSFDKFPLSKYELLLRLLKQKYRYETTRNGVMIYRLRER